MTGDRSADRRGPQRRFHVHDADVVACSLTARDAAAQALEWVDLQRLALRTAPLVNGARMTFAAEHAARIVDLAEREAACCAFLTITTSLDGDECSVDVTADHPAAGGVIAALSGVELA